MDGACLACAVSHNTAAWLMGLGELEPEPVTLTCPARRQVAARGIRTVRTDSLDRKSVV